MYTWHPESWSKQARNMSNNEIWSVNNGWTTIEGAIRFFSNSYRAPIIRQRAAKRFGRYVRAGKVKNNWEEYYKHYPDEK
jgi:hypothetical protein